MGRILKPPDAAVEESARSDGDHSGSSLSSLTTSARSPIHEGGRTRVGVGGGPTIRERDYQHMRVRSTATAMPRRGLQAEVCGKSHDFFRLSVVFDTLLARS